MSIFSKKSIIITSLLLLFSQAHSQRMVYDVTSDSTIFLKAIYNEGGTTHVDVNVDGVYVGTIAAGGSLSINKDCSKFVKAGNKELWLVGDTAAEWEKAHPAKSNENQNADNTEPPQPTAGISLNNETGQKILRTKKVSIDRIVSLFKEHLEKDSFYSSTFVQAFKDEVDQHSESLKYIKDQESREEYIRNHQLREYLNDKETIISQHENGMDSFVGNFVASNFNANELPRQSEYETKLKNILEEKIAERKDVLDNCCDAILDEDISTILTKRLFSDESVFINVVLGMLITCIVVLIILLIRKSTRKKRSTISQEERIRQNANPDIVVRRKTTSILKKQSLEDVHHNPAYFPIDCADFCSDSAVRRIYLKNTCIKDIYNLYAEDLRNPENPNEDGCMVLGRWVHDDENDEYYVSLEEIVKPGDDAIFKEYELNFGGKIKLKVAEKLRRLRRETNLQYDMTCWVHSHPGLRVFFSNADSNVQMQLKHPTHPKFLVAIVIDILTPDQELGIFTFKQGPDLSINSKADLRKMYSLEELHKWAVESDRTSFKQEDHRNIMRAASNRIDSHYGVELSNGAIIDMCQLQTTYENGLLAWVHGYTCEKNGKREYILKSVSQTKHNLDDELIGCYINGSHCSIPTIKRVISNDFSNIRFILFYSTVDGILTAIPVVNGQISVDEACYGEEKLEDLKIWTRRKR